VTLTTPEPGAPNLARRAVSGVLWLGVLNSAASLFVLGLWAYLNRALPDAPGQMGLWMFVLKLLLFANLVFEGGLTAVLKQRKGLGPDQITAIGRIQAALGVAGGLLMYLLAPVAAPLFPALPTEELTHLLQLSAPVIVVIALGFTQKSLIERELNFRRVATIESVSTLFFVVLGVWLGREHGAAGLVFATLGRHVLETALYWIFGPLTRQVVLGSARWRGIGTHLRFGGSILAQSLLGNMMRHADVLIAGILLTDAAVAVYAQLQLFIALPLSKITMYAARVAFPTFAHVQDEPQRLINGLNRLQRLTALAVFPALAGLVAVGPRLFWLYLGPEYQEWLSMAWPALLVLCVGAGIYTYSYGVAVVLNAVGDAEALLKRQAVGAALVVGSVSVAGMAGFLPMAAGRSAAIAVAGFLFLALGQSRLGFDWGQVRSTVHPALLASVAMGLLVAGLGLVGTALLPQSDPFASAEARAATVSGVLGAQVLAGVVIFPLLLKLMGHDPLAEARALLDRRRGVEAPPVEG
jgi:O-antigen/teichoic acid export membrane protein